MPPFFDPPKYSRQSRPGGYDRAYVRVDGERAYLGRYGSAESQQKYAELIGGISAELTVVENEPPANSAPPTVNDLLVAFLEFAQTYYRQEEGTAKEYSAYLIVAKWLRKDAGRELAEDFWPKRLKRLRESMVAEGWQMAAPFVSITSSTNSRTPTPGGHIDYHQSNDSLPKTKFAAVK